MNYPEDIVNNMSLHELQNCDWDALFNQIQQQTQYNNNYYNDSYENRSIFNQNMNTVAYVDSTKNLLQKEKKQDIVIARKPIFIPLGKDRLNTCRALEFHNALFLQSKFNFNSRPKLSLSVDNNDDKIIEVPVDGGNGSGGDIIFDCKICDETFQTRASLITHVKVHQQPFCVLCLSPFKSISGYRIHNSKLHKIPWMKNDDDSDDEDDDNRVNKSEQKDERHRRAAGNNLYDIYDNLNTITLTSKYGRRRKVLDMTTVITKKSRKSK